MNTHDIEQERADFEEWFQDERGQPARKADGTYSPFASGCWRAWQARAAIEADRNRREAPEAEGWPEPLTEFSEGQWWVKALDALKDLPGASNDQKRAVAVVHHLLASVDRHRRGTSNECEPVMAKHQPCGCVICTCEDNEQCHGCGAHHCGKHPIAKFSNPVYEPSKPISGEPVPKDWKLVPETPTSKQIVHMACQIKGADADGWFRTDGDDWHQHVAAAERAYKWALSEAPQPTEPVKVPSDGALDDALSNLAHDNYELSYSGYKNRQADIALIRAALAPKFGGGGDGSF